MKKNKVDASTVRAALRVRHRKDVFLEEVKNGRSYGNNLRIMDAWAMKLSWSPVRTIGYEIKVSRSDFVGDEKWPEYLKLCHQLFFVAPKGLIESSELPPEVGLIELLGTTRLVTRKKAPYRTEVNATKEFENLLLYLAMRCGPVEEREGVEDRSNRAYWTKWLAEKKSDFDLGRSVGWELRRRLNSLRSREQALEQREQAVEVSEEFIKSHGLTPTSYESVLESQRTRMNQVCPPEFERTLAELKRQVIRAEQELAQARRKETNGITKYS